MTADKHGEAAADARLRADRDRFVAFAFCWCDLLVELDVKRRIIGVFGPSESILGYDAAAVAGQPFLHLVSREDRDLAESLLDLADGKGRISNAVMQIDWGGKADRPVALACSGYRFADLDGHFFLGLRHPLPAFGRVDESDRDASSGLRTGDGFSSLIERKVGTGELPADALLTLVKVDGLDELENRLDEKERRDLATVIGALLRARSLDGDSATVVADGRFGLLHDPGVEIEALSREIGALARKMDPRGVGVEVEAASVGLGEIDADPKDLANSLIFALNRFRSSKGGDFDIASLSSNISDIVSRASETVVTFRKILRNKEFDVAFQPIVDARTKALHHYEALVRFHKDREGISPFETISFAEESGLIPHFDLAMAGRVLERLSQTPLNAGTRVAVNVSGKSVNTPWYTEGLYRLLEDNVWARGRLLFEITESSRIDDLHSANRFIRSLRKSGYEVCLDDFGAGAANFQYMSTLDVDVVKFDGPVIKQAQAAHKGKAFFKALVTLCHNLGVETIAEMIDSEEGLSFVRECGVDLVQGYLVGMPGPTMGGR